MRLLAHRGLIERENTVSGILEALRSLPGWGVELDVRFSTDRSVVLCHDREKRNDQCDTLCHLLDTLQEHMDELFSVRVREKSSTFPLRRVIMIDIKAFGVSGAQELGRTVCDIVESFPTLVRCADVMLCSFNEYCVSEILAERAERPNGRLWERVQVGVISSGIPLGLFEHLNGVDFVSIDYNALCEDIVDRLKEKKLPVFAWTVNADCMARLMKRYDVDGMIVDTTSETRDMYA